MEENQQIFRQPQAKITVEDNMLSVDSLAGARTRRRRRLPNIGLRSRCSGEPQAAPPPAPGQPTAC